MPVILPPDLPATQILKKEGRTVLRSEEMDAQRPKPLRIGLLNLMPDKIATETQFARLLGGNPYPVKLSLFRIRDHTSKTCSATHLQRHYRIFDLSAAQSLDGLIITGAPVEHLDYGRVSYWPSLIEAMDLAAAHVPETLAVCWGAMALAFHHHGLKKHLRTSKAFGCVRHMVDDPASPLVFGIQDGCRVPVSRWTTLSQIEIDRHGALSTLMTGAVGGPSVIRDDAHRATYVLNHFEYDHDTLAKEYARDLANDVPIKLPQGYFPNDDPTARPLNVWESTGRILYANWLNMIFEGAGQRAIKTTLARSPRRPATSQSQRRIQSMLELSF
ncbi:MAG: homoserine O-succinyltransferase [Pseudomonadota bacterium]